MYTKKVQFTQAEYTKMQERAKVLTTELAAVMVRLKDAREMGDLSENGAYKYAKFELGNIRRELGRLQRLLEHGQVVVPSGGGVAEFGSTVTVIGESGVVKKFQLVSKHETNPAEGKVSLESPMGKVLLGKKAGDVVKVTTPRGVSEYKVSSVM